MSDAELRVTRDRLGLSGDRLAALLGVTSRTLRHWEEGRYRVPTGVTAEVDQMVQAADDAVAALVADLREQDAPTVTVWRTDPEYQQQAADPRWSAGWWRAIAGRAAVQVPGTRIVYADQQ